MSAPGVPLCWARRRGGVAKGACLARGGERDMCGARAMDARRPGSENDKPGKMAGDPIKERQEHEGMSARDTK